MVIPAPSASSELPSGVNDEAGQTPPSFSVWLARAIVICVVAGGLAYGGWYAMTSYQAATIADLRDACRTAVDEENWAQLEESASEWLEIEQESPDALLYLAEAKNQQQDFAAAVNALLRVPDASSKSHAALLIASDLQFGPLGKALDGVDTLKRLRHLVPDSKAVQKRLIYFYAMTLQRQEMLATIREAIRTGTEPAEAYSYLILASNLSFTDGPDVVGRWVAADPDSEQLQVAYAIQQFDRISNAENLPAESIKTDAAETLRELRQRFPNNLSLYRYLLFRAVERGDVDEAGTLLANIPETGENDSVVWRCRGWYLLKQGRVAESRESLEQSRKLYPLDWQTWNDLAIVLRRQGELDRAEETSEIALIGKELRKTLMQLPRADDLGGEVLFRIGRYAERCGEPLIAKGAFSRAELKGYRGPER